MKDVHGEDFSPGYMLLAGWPVYLKNSGVTEKYVVTNVHICDKCLSYQAVCYSSPDGDGYQELFDWVEFVPIDVGRYVFLSEEECNNALEVTWEKDNFGEYRGYCELTSEMNTYILGDGATRLFRTYMMEFCPRKEMTKDAEGGEVYILRFPGATCGRILTDENNVIELVEFYQSTCYETLRVYAPEMEKIKEKYIGRKMIFFGKENL